MPELPEVEILVRGLHDLSGLRIAAVEVLDSRLERPPDRIIGACIGSIERHGKYIVMNLLGQGALIVHLRMSGRLVRRRTPREGRYTRMILHLQDGQAIYFIDPRRLGTVTYSPAGFTDPLGPEPLSPEFSPDALARLVACSRAPIKPLLLDQKRLAGVGNIYAAESLWHARIDPRRPADTLTLNEVTALHHSLVEVLNMALTHLGTSFATSISDYRGPDGQNGQFQNHLAIYGRQGEPCERCGEPIERIVQQGRSTYFCPRCQT